MSRAKSRPVWEGDDATFDAPAYRVRGYSGVAWWVMGWETEPTEDTEWDGIEERTGRVVCVMVGDDRRFTFDPDELTPLRRQDYCGGCGQIGCKCDAYPDEDEEVTA